MKFFTIEWWSGEIEDDHMDVFDRYREHIEEILPELTEDHCRLVDEVTLHDARLRSLSGDYSDASIVLSLDGSGYDESTKSYFQRRFELRYGGVLSVCSDADPEKGLPGPHGYGDLGYDEVDVLEPGLFEHRMLFSTGITLSIHHREFHLRFEDIKSTEAEQDAAGQSATAE